MNKIISIFTTLFGIGYSPIAPGTIGSIFSIVFLYFLIKFVSYSFLVIIFLITLFTNDFIMFLLILILFRFFDILKIFPINWVDKNIKNSFGVVLDDLLAGVYSIIVLYSINVFI